MQELSSSQFGQGIYRSKTILNLMCLMLSALSLCHILSLTCQAQIGTLQQGNGFTVFGRVYLPSGKPAPRVKVYLEGTRALPQETLSNDQGDFEFRGLAAGRYKLTAKNLEAPEQYSDPAESETSRAYSNRLQINVYLRLPLLSNNAAINAGTVSIAEVGQNVPKDARKAYEQGLKLQKEKKADQAITQFNQAIKIYPEFFQALTERGNLLLQQNKLAEAEADFTQALKQNPKYPAALRGLGHCQIQQRNFPAALGNLEMAYSLEPQVPMTLLLLGYANLSLNRYEEAKVCLQEAIKIGQDNAARAHVYLAEVYAHEKGFKEAADEIQTYLKINPNAADAAKLKEIEAKWRENSKSSKKP